MAGLGLKAVILIRGLAQFNAKKTDGMKAWIPITVGLGCLLIACGCTSSGLKRFGLDDVYVQFGRDRAENRESRGLLDTTMGSLTVGGKAFTPAEEERAQKALSELQDGETINWQNPHFGKMVFGPPKSESAFWDPDQTWTSTWQNETGLTCRVYALRFLMTTLGITWVKKAHDACLKNGRWIPGPADRVSTS